MRGLGLENITPQEVSARKLMKLRMKQIGIYQNISYME